ncbi:retrotran gag 3 domain-containing protein [Citrus sinensis]|nr:retrotran gag 3 domain-containing protein [Citrus sinensis]
MEDQTQTKTKDKEASGSGLGKTMMSPYFLSASDNPGTIITQPADDSADLEDWWMVNSMFVSWIQNTIEPNLRSTVTYTEVAKLLWDDIKERFSIGNGPCVQQLKSELANCKQRGMTILNYYGKVKMLWEELSNYEQSPACLCGNCICNIGAEWDKKRDEEKLHQFLMGLDKAVYSGVRSHILSTEPLPKLNRAYAIVIQEDEPVAFVVQAAQGSHNNRDKSFVLCTHCNKTGHKASSCFQLIGYPEWWGERPKAMRNAGRGRGNSRQNSGNNRRGRGGLARANAAQVATWSNNLGLSGLSSEQWNTLLNLLNSQKDSTLRISGKLNSMEWILDTGASHHMTGNRKILHHIVEILTRQPKRGGELGF